MEKFRKKEVYSSYDLALLCQVELGKAGEWFHSGEFPVFKIPGGHLRAKHEEIDVFLDKMKIAKPENWLGEPEKFRVLVVEDDVDLLEILGDFLADELRLEVRKESDGFSAGLAIASWRPDLILLDFVIPGMDGFQVCRKLRANSKTADIPILAVTSLRAEENRKAVMEVGVSEFINKPFYSEEIINRICSLLGVKPASAN